MKNQNYYVGLDIGTDSVGYAVTDEAYKLCKFKGEPMWGVTLFDSARLAAERRGYRASRRRLDRRQQRVKLIMDLFANEIAQIDERFFIRIKESYLYPETKEQKVRLFDSYENQKEYLKKYPTIHHLIVELMNSSEPHDVRLVYIACAWLVAHRGHFLSEVDKQNIDGVTDFSCVFEILENYITRYDYPLPWRDDINIQKVKEVLQAKLGVTQKSKELAAVLFDGGKAPKAVNETYKYNYECVVKLLCGETINLKDLFGKEEYGELNEKSVALNMDDEKLAVIMQSIGDDAEFIIVLKAVYDWSVLVDILKGKNTVSEAKKEIYEQHGKDLEFLKYFVKKYIPEKYKEIFRSESEKSNYVAYIGKNKASNGNKKSANKESFCKYILPIVKHITPDTADLEEYKKMVTRLEANDFMPKQVDGDNRVIPYQLYWHELNMILENAKTYLPFLNDADENGMTVKDKIISVFEFRIPYYVGCLKEKSNAKFNHWMVRNKGAEGKIYPWNFEEKVNLRESEEAFIRRMTNSCTYLPGEDVLPKNSLVYCAFEVLNEINNIKLNGNEIPVEVKQGIYENVFKNYDKVSPKRIRQYLESNGYAVPDDIISGLDITVKSSLKPFRSFKKLIQSGTLSYSDAENIINRLAYSEDKIRFRQWLYNEYSNLPHDDIKYISDLNFKGFGRLSRRLLCGIEDVHKKTGEMLSIIRMMWETNCNFMQLMSDNYNYAGRISEFAAEYYGQNPESISERLDKMYISSSVKRPVIRTLDILKDIVKVQGQAPDMIFIEMARGSQEDKKGRRTETRLTQLRTLYKKIDTEDVRELNQVLDTWGDTAHNKLQSDKLFLYFMQLGKCLYTGETINIESVLTGDGTYNIEHIYPRSFVTDNSVINNEILVDSKKNGSQEDRYPKDSDIQHKMQGYWKYLNSINLLSDEKYKRLTRTTPFTDDEKYEFINRQLVETRQSTKALASLLKDIYPDTEIVYVKAGLVSDFRHTFKLLKSRSVNDLHHAKDAYLNIVSGSVWHYKFSRRFYIKEADNNVKTEQVYTHPVKCGDKIIWNGAKDKNRVVDIARKNTAHVTKYSFCRKGGFFDQMPLPASDKLFPRKKNMPAGIYGGYNKTTAAFFVLVKYKLPKKHDIMVMPVELLFADKFMNDRDFAYQYAKKTIEDIVNKPVSEIEFLLNMRPLKVNTMLSLNGLRVCMINKTGERFGVSVITPFKASFEDELYIKRLESFKEKQKKNPNIVCNEEHDGISAEKNIELYEYYIEKFQKYPYKYRPANPVDTLVNKKDKFKSLTSEIQIGLLLEIQGLFGRAIGANLKSLGGKEKTGKASLSIFVSNWKKNYTDVRIVDQSASGLFENVSENLLDLL